MKFAIFKKTPLQNTSDGYFCKNVRVRSQLRNFKTIEITKGSTKMLNVEVKMKKTSRQFQMLKMARNECHQLLQQNKDKGAGNAS